MARWNGLAVVKLSCGEGLMRKRGLRLLTPLDGVPRGPEKYRILELKRRRAQIRARRELGLVD